MWNKFTQLNVSTFSWRPMLNGPIKENVVRREARNIDIFMLVDVVY